MVWPVENNLIFSLLFSGTVYIVVILPEQMIYDMMRWRRMTTIVVVVVVEVVEAAVMVVMAIIVIKVVAKEFSCEMWYLDLDLIYGKVHSYVVPLVYVCIRSSVVVHVPSKPSKVVCIFSESKIWDKLDINIGLEVESTGAQQNKFWQYYLFFFSSNL